MLCLGAVLFGLGPAAAGAPRQPPAHPASVTVSDKHRVLLDQLVGTWDVRQRMWTGPDSDPVTLPDAIAHRRLVHGAYVEEEMTLAEGADGEPFTRSAVISWNGVNQSYEYFSLDSRLPQMMMYPTAAERGGSFWFPLEEPFVAPTWGDDSDVPFTARLQLRPGEHQQVVRLYLRRLSAEPTEEFLAFDYVYTRAH